MSVMAGSTLLVEDDRSFSSLAAAVLRREGMTVTLARSLHEARAALSVDAPEIVILDRRLPDGDGMEFLPEVRARVPAAAGSRMSRSPAASRRRVQNSRSRRASSDSTA